MLNCQTMKPYYQDNSVTIYNGDCADIVPQLGKFDLLLTDPPYGMNYVSNYRSVKHSSITGDNSFPLNNLLNLISKAERASYVFCRWDNIYKLPKPKSFLVWVKNNWSMGDLKHEHGRQWEACCFYPQKKHEFIKRISDVIICDKTLNNLHPTQKPVELMRKIISCNVGEIILDPYGGVGATARAAKDLGRKCILIEIEEQYCEIAAKRMAQEVFEFA